MLKTNDEREGLHRMIAGKFAFLVESGIMVQSFDYAVDPWLVYSLVGMTLTKIVGLFYGQKKY